MESSPELFVTNARKYVGYTSEALGQNIFGRTVGYPLAPWAGAFIDVVLRESKVTAPSFVYTPSGLAEFQRNGQLRKKPRPGDIAIFNFASTSASAFSAPHAGIVIDVRELLTNGRFLTIEGNVTGTTTYQQQDGVHQRVRYVTDVIGFCRPATFDGPVRKFVLRALTACRQVLKTVRAKLTTNDRIELAQLTEAAAELQTVDIKKLIQGAKNKHVTAVQLALSQVTDINGCERGKWDQATASAFARFQRSIGRVGRDANGAPEARTLERLASDTNLFKLDIAATLEQ